MRAVVLRHLDAPLARCSRCDRRRGDLLDRAHGERICSDCRRREAERYEAATGQCHHDCGFELAYHDQPRSITDECPPEHVARARSGDR